MKYFVSLILSFLVCSHGYSQDLVLTGELEGFEDGTPIVLNPFLDNMDIDQDDETVLLLKDGKFKFFRHLDKPTKFSIRVRPKNPDNVVEFEYMAFWSENVPMTLKGTKRKIFQSIIQGSLIQDQYFQYVSRVAKHRDLTKQIMDSIITLPNLGEDKKSEMRIRFHAALKTIEEEEMEFIFSNPNYYCTAGELVLYITFFPDKIDKKRLKEFYTKMSPTGQSNIYGKQIGVFLMNDTGMVKVEPLEVGDFPYNFLLKDTSGSEVKFSLINNKVILLDFWASGCGPCRSEHKNYVSLYKKFKQHGLEIVSVSQDQSKKKMTEAVTEDEMSWICLWDENRKVSRDLYNVSALPTTYLIVDGKVVAMDLGGEELRQKLEDVFNKSEN